MILKNSLLYSLEHILNLVFILHRFLLQDYLLGGVGLFLLLSSSLTAQIFATRAHTHIYPVQRTGCAGLAKKLKIFLRMSPFLQIFGVYRCNMKNQGLRHYLYYRLALTHYVSHMLEALPFVILRLSQSTNLGTISHLVATAPVLLNIAGVITATLDWEKCKRYKNQSSYDTTLMLEWCCLRINVQSVVRFLIYTLMIVARSLSLFILFYALEWAEPGLPFLVYGGHFTLMLFLFMTMWLKNDTLSLVNFLKTIVLSFNATFFNQLDCFLQIPFKLHFVAPYLINTASVITIVVLHVLFEPNSQHFHAVEAMMGYCAIAMYLFAGVFVLLYKKWICPDVLKCQVNWKFDKSTLTEV